MQQANVLDALVEACRKLVAGRLSTFNMMNSLEYVMLALDELVDGGTILEIEGGAIAGGKCENMRYEILTSQHPIRLTI